MKLDIVKRALRQTDYLGSKGKLTFPVFRSIDRRDEDTGEQSTSRVDKICENPICEEFAHFKESGRKSLVVDVSHRLLGDVHAPA